MTYASETTVTPDRSRSEIERTLERYGADAFSYGWDGERAIVAFRINSRAIKITLDVPPMENFIRTSKGRSRSAEAARRERDKATRQRWRALALVIKAKLEAVEAGIETLDESFMAHIVLPDGGTVGDFMAPQIASAYESGAMPALLPAGE